MDIRTAKGGMRTVALLIKLAGLVIVGYETSWIAAVGLFIVIWGDNITARINVVEELIVQNLISEDHR